MSNVFRDITKFAPTFLYIVDKDQNKVKLRFNPTQLAFHQNRSNRDIVLKPRQKGISTYVLADYFRMAITQTVNTATLLQDDDATQLFRFRNQIFYDGIKELICKQYGVNPDEATSQELARLPIPKREYSNATITTYPEYNSRCYIATVGSASTGKRGKGRGGTYSHVHASEVAFWQDAQRIVSGLMQGGNPQIIMESTPNGAQGYYYDTCMEVLDQIPDWQDKLKLNKTWLQGLDWRLHFFSWFHDNEYQLPLEPDEVIEPTSHSMYSFMSELELIDYAKRMGYNLTPNQLKWRRAKIRELKHEFIQEYPEDLLGCFILSGMGYFGDIRHAIMTPDEKPIFDSEHKYYGGLDFGQSNDFTVLSIIDKDTKQQVDMLRINRMEWGEMRRQIKLKCAKWGVKFVLAEKNSMGSVNIEELKKEFSASNTAFKQELLDKYPETSPEFLQEYKDGKIKTKILEFTTTNLSKAEIMSDLHEGIHEYGLKLLPDENQKRELMAFTRKYTSAGTPILEAPESEHDDTVIALALAWHCAMKMGRTLIH
jgi:hypothetical protein